MIEESTPSIKDKKNKVKGLNSIFGSRKYLRYINPIQTAPKKPKKVSKG